jgi:DNA-binding NtrC family response regulator
LVISDLRMPWLNGLELLKKVKTSSTRVRTILMSAHNNFDEDPTYMQHMKGGIIDTTTIENPVTIQRVCQTVTQQLENYNLRIKQ